MEKAMRLVNKGWINLSNQEQRDVVAFLAKALGVTQDSVRNWIGGGIPRRIIDKPHIYKKVDKEDWKYLKTIFAICCDGKRLVKKVVNRRKPGELTTDELMEAIDRMSPRVKRNFFAHLYRNNRKLYNEISELYHHHCKYNDGGRNISRYTKKKENRIMKEGSILSSLQNGGKIKSFGRIL